MPGPTPAHSWGQTLYAPSTCRSAAHCPQHSPCGSEDIHWKVGTVDYLSINGLLASSIFFFFTGANVTLKYQQKM